jgi:hypothetical protein
LVGNGLIQPIKLNSVTNVVAERTAQTRGADRPGRLQAPASICQVQRRFNSRTPDQFVYNFHAAVAKKRRAARQRRRVPLVCTHPRGAARVIAG